MGLNRVGLKNARRLGLRVNVDRRPTNDELKAVLAGREVVRIKLHDEAEVILGGRVAAVQGSCIPSLVQKEGAD